jgi:hypothetical protein
MAIVVSNTNYTGEVLEQLLTVAATSNEMVDRGLIRMVPGVKDKFFLPRIKPGKMLQKRKEMPTSTDAKGDFAYSERILQVRDVMVYTEFNPRTFESVWRPFQPKGNLVFEQLPSDVQNTLLSELAKTVKFEIGDHLINGVYAEGTDDTKLFDGYVTIMGADADKVTVASSATTMMERFAAVKKAIPAVLRLNPGLRLLCSITDFDRYDEELTALPSKGPGYTDAGAKRYKGITIEPLTQWPDDLIVATICGNGMDTNLWAGCNLQDDQDVVQIDKVTNAGERYFMKILLKLGAQTAWGENTVWADFREAAASGGTTGGNETTGGKETTGGNETTGESGTTGGESGTETPTA